MRIICGDKVIKTENTERGIEEFRIHVANDALYLEHWLISNEDEKCLDSSECSWEWVWEQLNGVGASQTLPR